MQGFQAKKRILSVSPFPFRGIRSILGILPFHAFGARARIKLDYNGWKANVLINTPRKLQQCNDKMSYLNQMYEKKAMEGYA